MHILLNSVCYAYYFLGITARAAVQKGCNLTFWLFVLVHLLSSGWLTV